MSVTTTKRKKYQVISPDGFTIEREVTYYRSKKKAIEAFENWRNRFTQQGYYSSNNGRICLSDLPNHCTFRTI